MKLSNPSLASERFKRGKSIENKEMMEEEAEDVGKVWKGRLVSLFV